MGVAHRIRSQHIGIIHDFIGYGVAVTSVTLTALGHEHSRARGSTPRIRVSFLPFSWTSPRHSRDVFLFLLHLIFKMSCHLNGGTNLEASQVWVSSDR